MPGTPSNRRTTCVVRFATAAVVEYDEPASDVWNVNTFRASSPDSTERSPTKLRISSAAPTSSTTASAVSTTTSAERIALVTHTGAGSAAGLLERRDEVGLGGVQRRKQTEHDSRQNRERHREGHDAPVERRNDDPAAIGRCDARDVAGHQQQQTANARCAEGEAEHASRAGQQHALGQQLTDHASATGADRASDRELALPARRSREQQVGHVAARDQQHERDRAEQHQQRRSHVARRRLAHRHDGDAFLLVHPLRIQLAEIARRRSSSAPAPRRR